MTKTTKTVEQLVNFLAHKLSPTAHHIFAIYLKMAIVGAWERIWFAIAGVILGVILFIVGIVNSYDPDSAATAAVVLGIFLMIGSIIVGIIGIGHLYDPQYQVIQLLITQAGA